MFSLLSVCLSTPPAGQATYAAGGMPLAVSQEDFLVVFVCFFLVYLICQLFQILLLPLNKYRFELFTCVNVKVDTCAKVSIYRRN